MKKFLDRGKAIFLKNRSIYPKNDWSVYGFEKFSPYGRLPIQGIERYCLKNGFSIPEDLRKAMYSLPKIYDVTYELDSDPILEKAFGTKDLYGGFTWFNFDNFKTFEEYCSLIPQNYPGKCDGSFIPFIKINNGDLIAVHVQSGNVWYLDHSEQSNQIAPTLFAFYEAWSQLAFIGPEIWFLNPLIRGKTIRTNSALAKHLISYLDRVWSKPVIQREESIEENDEEIDENLYLQIENALLGKGSWDEVYKIVGFPLTIQLDSTRWNPQVGDIFLIKDKATSKVLIKSDIKEVRIDPVIPIKNVELRLSEQENAQVTPESWCEVEYEIQKRI